MEKFPRQVPISGLVPLSLAYGSGLLVLYLKNHNAETLANRLNQLWTVRIHWFDHHQQQVDRCVGDLFSPLAGLHTPGLYSGQFFPIWCLRCYGEAAPNIRIEPGTSYDRSSVLTTVSSKSPPRTSHIHDKTWIILQLATQGDGISYSLQTGTLR